MITKIERPGLKGGTDYFAICDLPGFADLAASVPQRKKDNVGGWWYGHKDYATSLDQVRNGDLSGVAASEALLDKLETENFVSPVWRNRLDVVGGAPCVPAFLAGHPMNMRRRERVMVENGPLAVIVAMSISGGIGSEIMRARGAALLALVRMLSANRPVELWTAVAMGGPGHGEHVLTRLDTAPLDLARAAHMLTCPSVTRGLGYASCHELKANKGQWPHNDYEGYQRNARELYSNVIGTSGEVLYVGAAHVKDEMVTRPLEWLKKTLALYGGAAIAE